MATPEKVFGDLGEACQKTGWEVHAYCLMGNHFHPVVATPQLNLVAGMRWFLRPREPRIRRAALLMVDSSPPTPSSPNGRGGGEAAGAGTGRGRGVVLGADMARFSRRHREFGHLVGGRYKWLVMASRSKCEGRPR